jgi:hypothetical protein
LPIWKSLARSDGVRGEAQNSIGASAALAPAEQWPTSVGSEASRSSFGRQFTLA